MSQTEEIRKPSFYSIQEEIANMLAVPDNELDDEQRAAMNQYLNELAEMEAAKVDGFAQFVRLQNEAIEACKKEAEFLDSRAKTMEKSLQSLKEQYVAIMQKHGLKKIKGNAYSISVRRNESVDAPNTQPSLKALFEEEPLYVREKVTVEYSADKGAMKEALKAGLEIPGCSLKEGFSLIIK